jgi:hypothetical protein
MYVYIHYNDEVSLLEKAVSIAAPVAAARAEWHGLGRVDSGFGGAEGGGGGGAAAAQAAPAGERAAPASWQLLYQFTVWSQKHCLGSRDDE